MYKSVLYVSVLGALFRVSYSDFSCFFAKAKNIEDGIDSFFEDSHGDCKSAVREILTKYRQAIKDCSVPVTTDKMEVVLEEICDPDPELFNGVLQNAMCLSLTTKNKGACRPEKSDLDPSLSVKDSCEKLRDEYFTCLEDIVGKPCGSNAFKAIKRIYETRKTLTDGLCDEIAKIVDPEASIYPKQSIAKNDDAEASIYPKQSIVKIDDSGASIYPKQSIAKNDDPAMYLMYWIFGVAVVFSLILIVIEILMRKNLNEKPFNV